MPPRRKTGKKGPPPSSSPENSHRRHRRRNMEKEEEDDVVNNVLSPLTAMANLNDATEDDGSAPALFAATAPAAAGSSSMPPFESASGSDGHSNSYAMDNTSSSDSNASDDAPSSDSDDVTGSDEEYSLNDEDEDMNFLELLDDLEQESPGEEDEVDVEEMIPECNLELEDLEHDKEDDKVKEDYNVKEEDVEEEEKRHVLKSMGMTAKDLFTVMKDCDFKGRYVQHRSTSAEKMKKGLMREILKFIVFTENLDISKYKTAADLESVLNERRGQIGDAMANALRTNGRDDLVSKINLGSKFSINTLILFYLHYAPEGCVAVVGDKINFCRPTQCCIHTMFTKLYNFLANEVKYGSDKMKEWRYGGRREEDVSDCMAAVDLIPFLLEKMDKESDMIKQYQRVALFFGLESYLDLMIIPFCIAKLHIKLFEKQQEGVKQEANPGGELQEPARQRLELHFCGAASTFHILGIPKGVKKYLERFTIPSVNVTVGPHPQCWLMGLLKNRSMFPTEIAKMIAENTVSIYSYLGAFSPGFQSQITNIFGGGAGGGINLPMYNHTAKKFRDKRLLQLDERVVSESVGDVKSYVKNILAQSGLSLVVSSFVVEELENATLKKVMDCIRKISACHEYKQLAKTFRDKNLLQLDELVESDSGNDEGAVVSDVLARNGLSDDVSSFINGQMKTATLKTVMDRIRKTSDNQESHGLKRKLAGKFYGIADDNGGGDSIAIRDDNDFKKFCQVARLEPDQAITKLVELAKEYKTTFWDNVKRLENYIELYPNDFEYVGDERILTIDKFKEEGKRLHLWVMSMSGYAKEYYDTENRYGILAYEHMESVEQKALADLGMCFNPEKFKQAMEQRTTSRLGERYDPSGRRSDIMATLSFFDLMPNSFT